MLVLVLRHLGRGSCHLQPPSLFHIACANSMTTKHSLSSQIPNVILDPLSPHILPDASPFDYSSLVPVGFTHCLSLGSLLSPTLALHQIVPVMP